MVLNGFVDYKVEDNKELVATVEELNESFTETYERYKKFQSDLKFKKIIVIKAN